jgi:uncharacterized cupin superfamily protein
MSLLRCLTLALALAPLACANAPLDETSTTAAAATASGAGIDYYGAGQPVDDGDFLDVTAQIPALGGTVLEGNPTIKVRFDSPPDGVTAHGVFEQLGKAKIRIVFPFDEHIQVIHGLLKITDASGNEFYFGPGDSYFMHQGTVVMWETLTPRFQKSFFDYTHPQ